MSLRREDARQIWMYVIIIFSVLNIGNMWRCVFDGGNIYLNITYIIAYLGCLIGICSYKKITKLSLMFFLGEAIYFLLYAILNLRGKYITSVTKNVFIVFMLMTLYFINVLHNQDEQKFFRVLSNVVCIVATVSIFFWIFGSVLDVLPGRHTIAYEWATLKRSCYTFFHIYYEIPVQSRVLPNGFTLYRNTAIFPESPGCASFFIIGLINELFFKEKKNKRRIEIVILALLSTLSTKGFLVLIEIAAYYIWQKMKDRRSIVAGIMIIISPILLLVIGTIAYYIILVKSGTSSFLMRSDDLHSALAVWAANPMLGSGYVTNDIIGNFTVARSNNGLSMGIAVQLAKGGIYMMLIYVVPFIFLLRNKNRILDDFFDRLMVTVIIFTEFFISNVATHMTFILLISIIIGITTTSSMRTEKSSGKL